MKYTDKMKYTDNSILSIEEKILLASLEETDTEKCIKEIDKYSMTVSFDDEMFTLLMGLRYKLRHEHINIADEIADIPDEEETD